MDSGKALFDQFWDAFSGWSLFLNGAGGALLGLVLGLAAAVLLQRAGWLGRRKRWHHWLLKLYFLLLPGLGIALGVQAGVLYGVQKETYRQIDGFKPQLQAEADRYLDEFQNYVHAQQLGAVDLREDSLRELLARTVRDYLREHPLAGFENREDSLLEMAGFKLMEGLREGVLVSLVTDQLVKKAAGYSKLDEKTLETLIETRFSELFSADFVLGLAKKQVASLMQGFYLGVLMQLLIGLLVVGLELGLSRWLGQLRRLDASLQPPLQVA